VSTQGIEVWIYSSIELASISLHLFLIMFVFEVVLCISHLVILSLRLIVVLLCFETVILFGFCNNFDPFAYFLHSFESLFVIFLSHCSFFFATLPPTCLWQ